MLLLLLLSLLKSLSSSLLMLKNLSAFSWILQLFASIINSFPYTVMLIIFKILTDAFLISFKQFFIDGFLCGSKSCPLPRTSLVFEFPLRNSETFPSSISVHHLQIAPPSYVPLQQLQFAVTLMSSEGKLSHLLIFYIIINLFL